MNAMEMKTTYCNLHFGILCLLEASAIKLSSIQDVLLYYYRGCVPVYEGSRGRKGGEEV